MPYIAQERRAETKAGDIRNPGELNYLLTFFIKDYLGETPNYARFNDVIGALECCKLELYRRWISPYEDKKIAENGDVY